MYGIMNDQVEKYREGQGRELRDEPLQVGMIQQLRDVLEFAENIRREVHTLNEQLAGKGEPAGNETKTLQPPAVNLPGVIRNELQSIGSGMDQIRKKLFG